MTKANFIDTTGIDLTGYNSPRAKPVAGPVAAKKRKGGTIKDAHHQWATRPADEAVFTFEDLLARTGRMQTSSQEMEPQTWGSLRVEPGIKSLDLIGPSGGARLSSWAIRQLCTVVDAPADYLTRLPAKLAADALNHGIQHQCKRKGEALMLRCEAANMSTIRSITSNRYERVWDYEIAVQADRLQRNGTWGPCEAFKTADSGRTVAAWGDGKLPLGWVGDRSTFIALADYEGGIQVNGSKLARFALLSNSEVGSQGLKLVFGLMDFACCNFILWGCQDVHEISTRHVGDVRERFAALTAPMSNRLASGEKDDLRMGLTRATRVLLGDNQADAIARAAMVTRLPKAHLERAYELAEGTPRYGDPRSVWGLLSGCTEASQELHDTTDKRTAADTAAAKLMTLVK